MTVWSFLTVSLRVSSTVSPSMATAVTVLAEPSVVTVKADAAVVEKSGSWKVRTSLLPSVVMAAEERIGRVL